MSNVETTHEYVPSEAKNYFQSDNFLKGSIGTDIVKSLLEMSGYTVCHYGYEYTLLDALSKRTAKTSNSETGRKIRKSPDLLVYDDEEIMLVEVKTRFALPLRINSFEMDVIKKHWNDAILVVIAPDENVFYAQRVSELEGPFGYYLSLEDFNKINEIFSKVGNEDISHYKEIASSILELFMSKTQKKKFERTRIF